MRVMKRCDLAVIALVLLTIVAPIRAAWADDVVVFAAASLKNALDDAAAASSSEGGAPVKNLLRGEFGAGQADRERRAGRHLHLGRSRLDGLPAKAQSDPAGDAEKPARQPARAGRSGGQQRHGRHQARVRSRRAAEGRPAGDGRSRQRPGRQIRQGGARKARGLGCGAAACRRRRKRARRPAVRRPQGDAARHRLRDRRRGRSQGQNRRRVSRGYPPADHLSGRR